MHVPHTLTLGTRASPLAVAQAKGWAGQLQALYPTLHIRWCLMTTTGDRIQDRFLSEVGGKGLFVKELEHALFDRSIDLAIHSLKDMPALVPEGLDWVCFPKRLEAQDVLLTPQGLAYSDLPEGALIGTSSLRRRAQLKDLRPDFRFGLLRGNIDTRLRKLQSGQFDAIVLAKAGLKRLGLSLTDAQDLPTVPAPGQGTLVIQGRSTDAWLKDWLYPLHDVDTEIASVAEREVMSRLGGDCTVPLGVYAKIDSGVLALSAWLATPEGNESLQETLTGLSDDPLGVANILVERLLERGAARILAASRV